LYGEKWASAHYAAETLGCYAILILPLAVNGITEAYAHAVMSSSELSSSNVWLLVCSLVNVGGTLILQRSLGPVSLIVANAMSMLVRIAFTSAYIRRRFLRLKTNTRVNLPSKTYFVTLAVFSAVSRMSSEKLRRNPSTMNLLSHTGCGGGILFILLVALYILERDAFKVLAKHDKSE